MEIRASDLRFTAEEAAQYLRDAMGLLLDEGQVAALEQRTEGWIAALQLAALSMQGRTDLGEFIETFAGDDRYIVDYLVEEVLQRQPEHLRRFLLDTSVLSRLTGPLCDAVTEQEQGRGTLERLDRENLFVIPLDDRRRWYRYHHLFADVLRARLHDEAPHRVEALHRRASAWYAEHDGPFEAVEHAVRGQDHVSAARLVEQALPGVRRERQEVELRRWLGALPDELVRASPSLTMGLVGALMAQSDLEGVEQRLQDAERWLEAHGDDADVLDGPLRTLPSTIAMYRAGQARLRGDVAATTAHARRARDLSGELDHLERGAAVALMGLAHWSSAQLDDAHRCYGEALRHLAQAGHVSDVLGCSLALADMEVTRGDLDGAMEVLGRGLRTARECEHPPRGTADMHVGLAALHVERHELDTALEHLSAGEALVEHAALPQAAYRSRVVRAQVRLAQQAPADALTLLEEADRLYDTDYSPDVRPVSALIARVWIARGRTEAARAWARDRGLSADDELSYLREVEHLTLARLLLAQARAGDGASARILAPFLGRLLVAAEQGRRPGSAIEVLVLQALLAQHCGDVPGARSRLSVAVERAERQRYARTVLEHGAPVVQLLRTVSHRYARHLVASAGHLQAEAVRVPRQHLPDRLSGRELEVLQLLASDLDGPDIARHLVVSVHTVRTHTKSIYAKLGVSSRREAVTRARQLDLLAHTP